MIRRWRDVDAFTEEVEQARVWAGFHYRFSARAGTAMGRAVGDYVGEQVMAREPSP